MCQPTRKVVCACPLSTYAQDNPYLISVEISPILNLARAKCEFSPLEFARAVAPPTACPSIERESRRDQVATVSCADTQVPEPTAANQSLVKVGLCRARQLEFAVISPFRLRRKDVRDIELRERSIRSDGWLRSRVRYRRESTHGIALSRASWDLAHTASPRRGKDELHRYLEERGSLTGVTVRCQPRSEAKIGANQLEIRL